MSEAQGEAVVAPEEVAPEAVAPEEVAQGETEVTPPVLESDKEEFQLPEKFKGKSAEDIAKAYLELEKMKGKPKEEETEEKANKIDKEADPDKYSHYQKLLVEQGGEFTPEQYQELEKLGFSREAVEQEIEFVKYQEEKLLNKVIEPLGGGKEKFTEVAVWANQSYTPEEVDAFNNELANATPRAQQALLRELYSEYDKAKGGDTNILLHTNQRQTKTSNAYKTQEEFFKDIGSEEYKNNPQYRAAVEAKMARSEIF